MIDITIKNVPKGCEEQVREMAAIAVERFIRARDEIVPVAVSDKARDDVDKFRKDNDLKPKYKMDDGREEDSDAN